MIRRSVWLLTAVVLAMPSFAAAQQCSVTVGDYDKNGQRDMHINGTVYPEKLTLDVGQNQTAVAFECSVPGSVNKVFTGSFFTYQIRMKGSDTININIADDWVGQVRNFEIGLGGGTQKLTIGGPGALKAGSKLVIDISGVAGNDAVALQVPNVDASEIYLKADLQDGDNSVYVINNNSITNGGRVVVNGNLVGVFNGYKFVNTGLVDGTLDVSLDGGSVVGNHPTAADSGVASFGGQVGPNGRLRFNADLNSGNDSFGGTVDLSTLSIAAGGELHIDVNGGAGNDTLSLKRDTTTGGTGSVAGLLDVNFTGGDGDDTLYVDLGGGGVVDNGTVRLRLDGGTGNDVVDTALTVDAASTTPTLDVVMMGGAGSDQMNANIQNNGPNAPANYGPAGMAILDGGWGTDVCGANGNGIIHERNCEQ